MALIPKKLTKGQMKRIKRLIVEDYVPYDAGYGRQSSFPTRLTENLGEHTCGRRVGPAPNLSDYDRWSEEFLDTHEKVRLYCPYD